MFDFKMKNLRFRLIHRRNISDKKTGLELTCSYKIHFISLNWMEDYTLEYCCFPNMKMVRQFVLKSHSII